MKKLLVLFAVAFMALAVQAQMSDNMDSGVAKAITGMEQQWASSAKMGNMDAVAPMLADNFVNMDSDGMMYNKAQTLDRMKGSKWQMNEVSDVKVTVHGNTAIATGMWQGKGSMADGKMVDAHEHWVDTWMKMANGKWQCIASASAPSKM
ncbi:MAG: nuclear transport factor 2 family protein [Candidatus Korobacteraceae bacterium]